MTPSEFREQFKEYTGAEIFLKFVTALHRIRTKPVQLRYWQETVWNAFKSENPEFDRTIEELIEALRICELHELELRPVETPVFRGDITHAKDYERERAERFPHASIDVVMVSESYSGSSMTTWLCAKCDEIMNASKWRSK